MNLLMETLEFLSREGKSPADVKWVGSENFGYFEWDYFEIVANVEYDAGYGAQEVADDLLVVGDDWWLERSEYDGAEGWAFKTAPKKPARMRKPQAVHGGMWDSLSKINDSEEPA